MSLGVSARVDHNLTCQYEQVSREYGTNTYAVWNSGVQTFVVIDIGSFQIQTVSHDVPHSHNSRL